MEINLFSGKLLDKLGIPADVQCHMGVFVSTILAIAAVPLLAFIPHFCLMQRVLHMPCPGCGITHSLLALSVADFGGSFRANPAGMPLAAGLCFQLLARPMAIIHAEYRTAITDLSRYITTAMGFRRGPSLCRFACFPWGFSPFLPVASRRSAAIAA
jgi:Protein of unknown function (DUF2752)